ncbi:MAG: hypothetical protein LBR56_07010, partial [Sporomusaceae bacterium]|nr:hypothetical protein [Sporomusaceae bacterium]
PATFAGAFVDTHVTLIDGIANHVRKLYNDMAAERYVLPGKEVSGEFTKGYEIKRTIMVDENEGYAIGHNPNAVEPYVCWQFRLRDHKKNYNWGVYGSEKETVDSFNARLFTYAAEKYRRNNKISLAWAGK